MRLRKEEEGVRPVRRAFAGRRLRVALAAAAMLGLSLTPAVTAAPANAAPLNWNYANVEHLTCLTSGGIYNGETTVYACNGTSNQTWHYGAAHGAYQQLINNTTGQCLSISGGSTAQGARAVEVNCSGNDADYWLVEPAPLVTYTQVYIQNQRSQDVIQIACNCDGNSKNVDQVPAPNYFSNNEEWYR